MGEPMRRHRWLLMWGLVLGGCWSNVAFDLEHFHDRPPRSSLDLPRIQVHFDRNGDLYPLGKRAIGLGVSQAAPTSLCAAYQAAVAEAPTDQAWTAAAADYGVALSPCPSNSCAPYEALQQSIRADAAARIVSAARRVDGTFRPIVVLIHGFRTAKPYEEFEGVQGVLESILTPTLVDHAVYVEVGWDGLRGVIPWGRAQYNIPLVGAGLRKLLVEVADLDPHIPVRVLTFSAGGPVAAHALWDASPIEDIGGDECAYPAYRRLIDARGDGTHPGPPVFEDVRALLIVPATGTLAVQKAHQTGSVASLGIAISRYDTATSTFGLGCGLWGDTCLASSPEFACAAAKRLAASGAAVQIRDVRLVGHSWHRALKRSQARALLDVWWQESAPATDLLECDSAQQLTLLPGASPTVSACGQVSTSNGWCQ